MASGGPDVTGGLRNESLVSPGMLDGVDIGMVAVDGADLIDLLVDESSSVSMGRLLPVCRSSAEFVSRFTTSPPACKSSVHSSLMTTGTTGDDVVVCVDSGLLISSTRFLLDGGIRGTASSSSVGTGEGRLDEAGDEAPSEDDLPPSSEAPPDGAMSLPAW